MSVCEPLYNMRKEHQELIHQIMIYPPFCNQQRDIALHVMNPTGDISYCEICEISTPGVLSS